MSETPYVCLPEHLPTAPPPRRDLDTLPTALSPPYSQSRFADVGLADVGLPGCDMPAEHFVDDSFSGIAADGGMSFAKNAKPS